MELGSENYKRGCIFGDGSIMLLYLRKKILEFLEEKFRDFFLFREFKIILFFSVFWIFFCNINNPEMFLQREKRLSISHGKSKSSVSGNIKFFRNNMIRCSF